MQMMLALCARICWFVTVPIIFHRLQVSLVAAQDNLDMLTNQEDFVPYASTCGNPTYALNVDKANNYMLVASENIDKAWKFSLAAIFLMCAEIIFPCLVPCLIACCEKFSRSTGRGTELLVEKDYYPKDEKIIEIDNEGDKYVQD